MGLKDKIKELMKTNSSAMRLVAGLYNLFHYNNLWKYKRNNLIKIDSAFLKNTKFYITGKENQINIGPKARLRNCKVVFNGNNCRLYIGGGSTIISNVTFWCEDDNSSIIVGNDFTMEGGHIASTEGECIEIGNDCMFSGSIEIRNGDSHVILDKVTNKRINPAKGVKIGDHVWLTANVKVLKGAYIPFNCIIGNSSLVSGILENENAIYGGNPVKLLRENIGWSRHRK